MKNTVPALGTILLTLSLMLSFCPVQAEALTREQSLEMKERMRAEDLAYQSRLRERLLVINRETWNKMMALKEQLDSQKEGSTDPRQNKIYEREYSEKVKKVRSEAHAARFAAKEQLNSYREYNRERIEKSYEETPERLEGEAGFRG